jgi:hypothetical protein
MMIFILYSLKRKYGENVLMEYEERANIRCPRVACLSVKPFEVVNAGQSPWCQVRLRWVDI